MSTNRELLALALQQQLERTDIAWADYAWHLTQPEAEAETEDE